LPIRFHSEGAITIETRVDEIADTIYRFSTHVADIGPTGFTFNQFLVDADQALLFHTGLRALFPLVSEAVASVVSLDKLCGDLLSQVGNGPAIGSDDIFEAAMQTEDMFGATCFTSRSAPTIRALADLQPKTLAIMHGSSYNGECQKVLLELADDCERRMAGEA
jgi:hypothetical protein